MDQKLIKSSKFISLVLRHAPERIGLQLDEQGWASVEELLRLMNECGRPLTRETLQIIIDTNDKRRFALSVDGLRIRAHQGHSLDIDLALEPREPPDVLYHGTCTRYLDSIRREGLLRGSRTHVHLSWDRESAVRVGQRHGRPVVLGVAASAMHQRRFNFYLSENGVWLTEWVPVDFIQFHGV